MDDIDRRMLIGAMGLGALAAVSKAGPITPPAGPVASTGRTLDEIYNKIPGAGGTGDGRIALPGGDGTLTIAQSGSYVLTGNRTSPGVAIQINANRVTLDLNGFSVSTSSFAVNAIDLFSGPTTGVRDIIIRNGLVFGGASGVTGLDFVQNVLLEDLVISRTRFSGIRFGVSSARNIVVRRCQVFETGAGTSPTEPSTVITGIDMRFPGARVENCLVSQLFFNSPNGAQFYGIYLSTRGVADRCQVQNDTPLTAVGINFVGVGYHRDCSVTNFSTAYSPAGVHAGGSVP